VNIGGVQAAPSSPSKPVPTIADPCIELNPNGTLSVQVKAIPGTPGCKGVIDATTGVFRANPAFVGSPTTTVTGAGVNVSAGAGAGLTTSSMGANAITSTGNITAGTSVNAQNLNLNTVAEGAPCTAVAGKTQYAGLAGGGMAMCNGTVWLALNRFRQAGAACPPGEGEGTSATDLADKQALICKQGVYQRVAALTSNFVLMFTQELQYTAGGAPQVVNKPVCQAPRGALATPGTAPQPLIVLMAQSEASATDAASVSGLNRFAVDTGGAWQTHLERSFDGATVAGVTLAGVYCLYP
jgi:hypothetical protein